MRRKVFLKKKEKGKVGTHPLKKKKANRSVKTYAMKEYNNQDTTNTLIK